VVVTHHGGVLETEGDHVGGEVVDVRADHLDDRLLGLEVDQRLVAVGVADTVHLGHRSFELFDAVEREWVGRHLAKLRAERAGIGLHRLGESLDEAVDDEPRPVITRHVAQYSSRRQPVQDVGVSRDTGLVLDLVLPTECAGCGAPSTRWCPRCARELAVKPDQPHLITPRLDPNVPVLSLGRYAGARRQAIVAVKEHGRADMIEPLAAALRTGLSRLLDWGIVDTPLTVVPAPTRSSAARRRGGDPVTRMALAATAGNPQLTVVQAVRMRAMVRDSVGLSSADRQRNVAGRVKVRRPDPRLWAGDVIVIDDIVTTGATACESVRVLQAVGARVVAVLTVANA
jgi:predicted amidophosphoribosyltransferase